MRYYLRYYLTYLVRGCRVGSKRVSHIGGISMCLVFFKKKERKKKRKKEKVKGRCDLSNL